MVMRRRDRVKLTRPSLLAVDERSLEEILDASVLHNYLKEHVNMNGPVIKRIGVSTDLRAIAFGGSLVFM